MQEVLDVLLPPGVAVEVGRAAHPPGLEEAGSISFLQRNRKPGVPGVEQANFAPVAGRGDLRVQLGDRINNPVKPLRGLLPPAAEGLNREGDETTAINCPGRITPVLALSSTLSGGAVGIGGTPGPS